MCDVVPVCIFLLLIISSKDIQQRGSSLKITQLPEGPSNSTSCLDRREKVSIHVKGKIFHVESDSAELADKKPEMQNGAKSWSSQLQVHPYGYIKVGKEATSPTGVNWPSYPNAWDGQFVSVVCISLGKAYKVPRAQVSPMEFSREDTVQHFNNPEALSKKILL